MHQGGMKQRQQDNFPCPGYETPSGTYETAIHCQCSLLRLLLFGLGLGLTKRRLGSNFLKPLRAQLKIKTESNSGGIL